MPQPDQFPVVISDFPNMRVGGKEKFAFIYVVIVLYIVSVWNSTLVSNLDHGFYATSSCLLRFCCNSQVWSFFTLSTGGYQKTIYWKPKHWLDQNDTEVQTSVSTFTPQRKVVIDINMWESRASQWIFKAVKFIWQGGRSQEK